MTSHNVHKQQSLSNPFFSCLCSFPDQPWPGPRWHTSRLPAKTRHLQKKQQVLPTVWDRCWVYLLYYLNIHQCLRSCLHGTVSHHWIIFAFGFLYLALPPSRSSFSLKGILPWKRRYLVLVGRLWWQNLYRYLLFWIQGSRGGGRGNESQWNGKIWKMNMYVCFPNSGIVFISLMDEI